ncbi:MAG: AAA family ATPase [Alphaproteobacteria bacterium]|nr:AAA family ATPase [Alphaproteobacteria bacterium]
MAALAKTHARTFKKLVDLERQLNDRFAGLAEPIAALVLSLAAGEALLLIGPPGTAKSRLIRAFCQCVGLLRDEDMSPPKAANGRESPRSSKARPAAGESGRYFEYLLTQFTEPGELFGFYDLAALQPPQAELRRDDSGMMQHARVVFLDEVFNASSAILNSLLAFMNERKFHDRGKANPVKLEYLVGATNDVPTSPELRAFFDRFLMRAWVHSVPADTKSVGDLLKAGWKETHATPTMGGDFTSLLDELRTFRDALDTMTRDKTLAVDPDPAIMSLIADRVSAARETGASAMSNRRLVGFAKIVLIQALLRGARDQKASSPRIEPGDIDVLLRFGVDRRDDGLDDRHRGTLA